LAYPWTVQIFKGPLYISQRVKLRTSSIVRTFTG